MRNLKDEITINCRSARKQFGALADSEMANSGMKKLSVAERTEIYRHIENCSRCAEEYQVIFLSRAALDLAASAEPVRPTEEFFKGLKARIERGPQSSIQPQSIGDESWAAALFLTARQLIPVMAVLLLIIIGATLIWKGAPKQNIQTLSEFRPRDKVIFNDIYEFPAPTRDDVLETLVAVEEKHGN